MNTLKEKQIGIATGVISLVVSIVTGFGISYMLQGLVWVHVYYITLFVALILFSIVFFLVFKYQEKNRGEMNEDTPKELGSEDAKETSMPGARKIMSSVSICLFGFSTGRVLAQVTHSDLYYTLKKKPTRWGIKVVQYCQR